MYISYYNLAEKPFQINTDPRFLWLSEIHKEALSVLEYGLINQNGILVLTGDAGTGKTTLINALLDGLDRHILVAKIVHSKIDLMGFLSLVSQSFYIPERLEKVDDFIFHFTNFLERKFIDNIRVLLIVDEAHNLSIEILEQIRLLSNIELAGKNLFCIYLVGQNELTKKLLSRECRALRQRVSIHYQIKPLSEYETLQYCLHRLKVAGSEIEIFDHKAITEIYRFSKGFPRLINIICDRALAQGYADGVRKITPTMIKECSRELRFSGEIKINMKNELTGTLVSAFNYISNIFLHSKIPAIYYQIIKQTKHSLAYLFNQFIAKLLFKISRGIPNKKGNYSEVDGIIKTARTLKDSFSQYSRHIKKVFLSLLKRTHENISSFMNSSLRNAALAICLVALTLIWSLWYQGKLSTESNLSISENSLTEPNLSASYKIESHNEPVAETYVAEKTEAMVLTKEQSGKLESTEAGLEGKSKLNNLDEINKVAKNNIGETKKAEPTMIKTAKRQPSSQKSTDVDWQDDMKSEPSISHSDGSKSGYSIQAGAFLIKDNAVKMASNLGKKGYSADIVKFNDAKGRVWHTVRIGDYSSRRVAKRHAKDFSSKVGLDSVVRPVDRF